MDYSAGDIIEYIPYGGRLRRVRVDSRDPDIKNGRAGFDGVVVDGDEQGFTVWGYDSQIKRIVTRNAD